jgi:hypothetical protein
LEAFFNLKISDSIFQRFQISNLWNLEFGIWNLEFGIWNLEFGIWNLEFKIV